MTSILALRRVIARSVGRRLERLVGHARRGVAASTSGAVWFDEARTYDCAGPGVDLAGLLEQAREYGVRAIPLHQRPQLERS